ncbi:SMI1/KNR4 family protein [Teredinibacter turnerae]|uniref:SMI1/KNR4 family protein n=1 Tax=Teredinibacter turnerae TaxID=2426 RepID=UPI00048FD65F|nr:SMI1/KNR4 family protein [Teredinibacter turnerae]
MDIEKISQFISGIRLSEDSNVFDITQSRSCKLASDDDIVNVEAKLNFSLCSDYKQFIKTWGQVESVNVSIIGMFYRKDVLTEVFYDSTVEYFSKEYFKGSNLSNRTIVGVVPEDEEWFYVLDHTNAIVTPYDPFARDYVDAQACSLEEFIVKSISAG